ncbi:AAEL015243-PA [Aedes aegypti]|uniref:AAEL015243-PA n=1 Tax=Aedes aegypti TaxID=7159 RepID=Q16EE3_AEDAE|nr:AAEL015243-PA [Aedes aegypti]
MSSSIRTRCGKKPIKNAAAKHGKPLSLLSEQGSIYYDSRSKWPSEEQLQTLLPSILSKPDNNPVIPESRFGFVSCGNRIASRRTNQISKGAQRPSLKRM